MKGSVGTATYIINVNSGKKKKKYKKKKGYFFCIGCRGWIRAGQWYIYTSRGTTRHFYKKECVRDN